MATIRTEDAPSVLDSERAIELLDALLAEVTKIRVAVEGISDARDSARR